MKDYIIVEVVFMKNLVFSKWYEKLDNDLFITLRKKPQCFAGEVVKVTIKKEPIYFEARCLQLFTRSLGELSDWLLMFDTDTSSRKDAIALLQSFYRNPLRKNELFMVHVMVKV